MENTLDRLIRDVQSVSTDMLIQLEEASRKASDFADLGESLLNHFVDQCRKSGKTWAEIGDHLGVTRQAVQKRWPSSREITFERYTERAKRALTQSRQEATKLNHSYVGTEHILLGLFDTGGGISDVVLKELGVTHEVIEHAVETMIGRGPTEVTTEQPFTPRATKVLEEAVNAAVDLAHNYIGTEHLLLGLYRGQDGLAKKLLEQNGADRDKVKAKVIEKLAGFTKAKE